MSLKFSDIQAATSEKYADLTIELEDGVEVGFRPVLKLSKEVRKEIGEALKVARGVELGEDGDIVDAIRLIFRKAERSAGDYKKLDKLAGEDVTLWLELFENYNKKADVGEA